MIQKYPIASYESGRLLEPLFILYSDTQDAKKSWIHLILWRCGGSSTGFCNSETPYKDVINMLKGRKANKWKKKGCTRDGRDSEDKKWSNKQVETKEMENFSKD